MDSIPVMTSLVEDSPIAMGEERGDGGPCDPIAQLVADQARAFALDKLDKFHAAGLSRSNAT